eukprot:Hpha_TRINITY_DN16380_c2_g5::TRINITY_DN16380_c2_g5_i1::g.62799::m.62799
MRAAALLLVSGVLVRAGEPDCSLNDCFWKHDDFRFGDAWLTTTPSGISAGADTRSDYLAYLHQSLCSASNWRAYDNCYLECPSAVVVSSPSNVSLRACVAQADFTPYVSTMHLDSQHPLNEKELEFVAMGGPGSEEREACGLPTDGQNYTGKIVFVMRGGCRFDTKAQVVAYLGGAACVIVDSQRLNEIQMVGAVGSSAGLEEAVTMRMSLHYGMIILDAIDQGLPVRGKLSLDCSVMSKPSPPAGEADGDCPTTSLFGKCDASTGVENEEDQLCSRCSVAVEFKNETDPSQNVSMACLYSHRLLPRVQRNSLIDPATAVKTDMEVHHAELIPGFMRDPNCKDDASYVEPFTYYTCADIEYFISSGQLPHCSYLLQFGFPAASVNGFLQNCFASCPKSIGGVGCAGGTGEGCAASDWVNAAGKVVAVNSPTSCLPFDMLRIMESQGVTAAIIMTKDSSDDWKPIFVQGLSKFVGIPVHSLSRGGSRLLRQFMAEAHRLRNVTGTTVTLNPDPPAAPPPETPAPPPSGPAVRQLEGSQDFEFTAVAIIAMTVCGILLIANIVVFINQRMNSVELPKTPRKSKDDPKRGPLFKIPLSAASTGLSLSLLMVIAVVAFSLAYKAGKDTTDTALDDGWTAVGKTHANAVITVGNLKDKYLKILCERVNQAIESTLYENMVLSRVMAKTFIFHDGTWEDFDRLSNYITEYSYPQTYNVGGWETSVRTTNGFYAEKLMKTDDRPNASRSDSYPHVSVSNDGFIYGVNRLRYKTGGNTFREHIPLATWDPRKSLGRCWGDAIALTQHLGKGSGFCMTTGYTPPIPADVATEFSSRPFQCLVPIHNQNDDYIGAVVTHTAASWFGTLLQLYAGGDAANMTIAVFDESLKILTVSKGRFDRVVDSYGPAETAGVALGDDPSIPLVLGHSGDPTLDAFAAQAFNGNGFDYYDFFGSGSDPARRRGTLEQHEWKDSPRFLSFFVGFDGDTINDISGEGWETAISGQMQFGPGARGTSRAVQFDGSSSLDVYRNLTTDIPRVRAQRNQSSPDHNPTYDKTLTLASGQENIAFHTWNGNRYELEEWALQREPLIQRSFSMSLWLKTSVPISDSVSSAPSDPRIFSDTLDAPSSVRIYANGKIVIKGVNNWHGCQTKPIPGGPPVDEWTHIVVSVDRRLWSKDAIFMGITAEGIQSCSVYVNGKLHDRAPMGFGVYRFDSVPNTAQPYRFGQFFQGSIDELAIYNTTMSEADAQSIMSSGPSAYTRTIAPKTWFWQVEGQRLYGLTMAVAALIPREDVMREVDLLNELQRQNQTILRQNTENTLQQR